MGKQPATPPGQAFATAINNEATHILDTLKHTGGYTGSTQTAQPAPSGYAINHIGACPTLPFHATDSDILNCLTTNADWFTANSNQHFGIWRDRERNLLILDRVTVIRDLHEATRVASERNQRSFFDLQTGKTIQLERRTSI